VLGHEGKGILAGALPELGEEAYFAAEKCLEASAESAKGVAGADHEAADDAEAAADGVARQVKGGGDVFGVDEGERGRGVGAGDELLLSGE